MPSTAARQLKCFCQDPYRIRAELQNGNDTRAQVDSWEHVFARLLAFGYFKIYKIHAILPPERSHRLEIMQHGVRNGKYFNIIIQCIIVMQLGRNLMRQSLPFY